MNRTPPNNAHQASRVGVLSALFGLVLGVASHYARIIQLRHDGRGLDLKTIPAVLAFSAPMILIGVLARAPAVGVFEALLANMLAIAVVLFILDRRPAACMVVSYFVTHAGVLFVAIFVDDSVYTNTTSTFWIKVLYSLILIAAMSYRGLELHLLESARANAKKSRKKISTTSAKE